jgi:O-antigen/teichoic acid export membrane protein
LYGLLELSVAFLASIFLIRFLLGNGLEPAIEKQASQAFFFMALGSGLVWNWGGIWVRGANATGNYARGASWGVLDAMVKVLGPLVVLPLGANLPTAALAFAATSITVNQLCLMDLRKLVRKKLDLGAPIEIREAIHHFARAQILSLRSGLQMLRQQGVRLILAPLTGAAELATFSTIRTGANLTLQGLNTITSPLMPELMRFLATRQQQKVEAAMVTVWFVVAVIMSPAVLLFQLVAPVLFPIWTRGKIVFDPVLFSTFSAGVLVFAAAQPAMAIIQGNNLLREQLAQSIAAATVAVGGMFLLVPRMGLLGAGVALLLAECVGLVFFTWRAFQWLRENNLRWPTRTFSIVIFSIGVGAIGSLLMGITPQASVIICITSLGLAALSAVIFVATMPTAAKDPIARLFRKVLRLHQ